jgi:hypothetical protein
MRTLVLTQDQLDKQARLEGRVRVVPVGMRKMGYGEVDGAIPDHWFYSDRIKEFSENADRIIENRKRYQQALKLKVE